MLPPGFLEKHRFSEELLSKEPLTKETADSMEVSTLYPLLVWADLLLTNY